ncbi:glycosyltransferase [Aliarcobacter thereius]|uniref:Glycosyltransferase n=1 Tax=Aliarcobacter thereius TaxID=544718 RepID=A0A5R9H170_9BACT|nr:glycosyltransferase family 2 protein [Aliarcobacter thereius]TLS72922.1 glycosyltransferase [Aliarcobacter thereius]
MTISLIITTYNWKEALKLSLESVKNQVLLPNEIIIADDGSRDDTKELIEDFKKNNPNLNIIHSWQEDDGYKLSQSRNRAIARASSEYIIVIDGDMILHKDFVKDHRDFAKKGVFTQGGRVILNEEKTKKIFSGKKISFSAFQKGIKNRKNSIRFIPFTKIFCKKNRKTKGIRGCNMSFFKEECIKVNGFNEDFVGWGREDSEFVERFYNNGFLRQNLKFAGIAYHIYHNENSRKMLEINDEILKNTIEKKLKTCKNGIDKYLN